MARRRPRQPKHEHEPHRQADARIDSSVRYHTRQALSAVVEHVETMTHAVAAVDDAMAEVFVDDEADKLRQAVVAARAGLLQVGTLLLEVERALGRVEGYAQVVDVLQAERPSS